MLQICVLVKDWNTSKGGLSFSNLHVNKPSLTRAIKLWTLYADLSEQSPRNNFQTERLKRVKFRRDCVHARWALLPRI